MKHTMSTRLIATALIASLMASLSPAAIARPGDDRHWDDDDRGRSRGHDRRDYDRDHDRDRWRRDRDVNIHYYPTSPRRHYRPYYGYDTVVVTPPPQVVYEPTVPYSRSVNCVTTTNPIPTILGGVAGGAIGTQIGKGSGRTAAIISGALIGGLLGNQYTSADRYCTQQVFETAPLGAPVSWENYDTGAVYNVTPTRDYRTEGRYCREYTANAQVGGRNKETYGTACMQPDGSWEIVN